MTNRKNNNPTTRSYFEQIEALIADEEQREADAQRSLGGASLDDYLDAVDAVDAALEELDSIFNQ